MLAPSRSADLSANKRFPLTPLQEGMLFHHFREPGTSIDIEQISFTIAGSLDVSRLRSAWQRASDRHEILRAAFHWSGDRPMHEILPEAAIPFTHDEQQTLAPEARDAYVAAAIERERHALVNLATPPLQRIYLISYGLSEHTLIWTNHHIVLDGRAWSILLREVFASYAGDTLAQPAAQFDEHVASLAQRDPAASEAFWRAYLHDFEGPTPLPVSTEGGGDAGAQPGRASRRIDARTLAPLIGFAREHGFTINGLLQAAWSILLARHANTSHVVFGAVRACRHYGGEKTENMVGLLINTLPLRIDVHDDAPIVPFLTGVRRAWQALRDHEQTPLRSIASWANPNSSESLFDSLVMYDRRPLERVLRDAAAITPDLYIGDAQTIDEPDTALSLAASGEDDLLVRLTARAPRYNVRDAERLLGQLVTILLALPHAATVGAISMLDAHEREHIVRDFNRSTPFPRASTIHDLFAEAARRTPDAIAVALRDETMTYRELETAGANVAAHLHALGVRPGDFVGVCVERSFAMVAALLGILKAGAASIALDPSHPEERVAFMLGEAGAAIVLAQSHLLGALAPALARPAAARARAVVLETLLASPAPDAPAVVVTADHGAHVMYTSGSTGTPKGAVLPHRAAVRTVCGTDYLRFAPDETFFGFVPLTFDVSVLEIWGPLLCGARLVLCPPGLPALDVLAETIEAGGVTTLWLTTALFEQMIDEHVSHLRNVRRLIVGGDVMSPAHARRAMAAIPGLQLINVYGPTEATVLITAHPLRTPPTGPIPLGSPIPNAPVYILDPRGEPVPVGVPGEIYTGGPGVALGYINRPDLTAQRFVPDPFSDEPGATMYRSGDLARWRSDGAVEFLGRVDTQVKIRGVRIELGEIEGALTDHCGVREAVVVARSFGSLGLLDKALVAYVVTRTGVPAPDSAALLEHLAARLPAAMVPAKVVFLPTLPRTETGKFDRKALPDPGPLTAVRASPEHRAPRSAAEIAVASHFADVLGIDEIGLDDDFYAFGGNSLRAMRLVSRLRDTFRVDLTIRDLLTAPRVATLTARIVALGRNEGVEQRSLITTLRDSGSRAPIFFLHGDLAGGGYYCGELARVFGDDRPMYVIAPHGTESPTMPWSVEEIAAENVAAVRALSPAGPVALGGFCAGGIVAYEMARQLAGSGVAVEHVVMLDPIIADRTLRRRIASALRPLRDRFRRPRGGPNAMWVAWHEELLDRWHVILARHSPRTYAGSVSVLWSDECSTTYDRYMARWRKLAPRVTQEFIPGTHLTTITRYLGHTSRAVAAAFGHDLDAERTAAGGTKG